MNTATRREAAEAQAYEAAKNDALDAWEASSLHIHTIAKGLESRGWSEAEAVECAEFEVMPASLVAALNHFFPKRLRAREVAAERMQRAA